jgi:Tfp pilus assembly protein PilN
MIRINLLPPEIIERRKWERFYPIVFVVAAGLIAIVLVVWFGLQLAVNQRNDELQQTMTRTAALTSQADAFAIFERKQQELVAREAIAATALAGRIDMGSLAEDISLVLPDETFLVNMNCDQDMGLILGGNVSMSSAPSVKQGYKAG